jgi:3-oxoacid CoA-transferase
VVNLGAGLPSLVANFVLGRSVILHSENGMLNYGSFVVGPSFDPDLHDASGQFVTVREGASFFDSVTSFEIARSGRLDAVVLGAYQVGANGDLANWAVPGMTGGGIGGAMDLAVGARQVIAMCEHTDSAGRPKLVGACSFEVTAPGCVDTVVTDLALLRRAAGSGGSGSGFRLEEIARGFSVDEVLALTPMPVAVGDRVGIMQEGWGD